VYHSIYDTHNWVARIGDPGFRYHVALVQLWGAIALRLADADAIPLDYEPYAGRIQEFLAELGRRQPPSTVPPGSVPGAGDPLADVRTAAAELAESANAFNRRRSDALTREDRPALDRANRQLIAVERGLLDPNGIPGRPWYRHQIYAPKFTYAPEVLPGVAEAMDARDSAMLGVQAERLAAALRRAAAILR
jgi:N-acetylated-alpha-linked acidic dipeptidase